MKKITRVFGGREALPVRAVPLVTEWFLTPQELALELSKPTRVRSLTAYRYFEGQAVPVRAKAWSLQHEVLVEIIRASKRDEHQPDQHLQSARRKSLKGLPEGVFVWLDEFLNWYSSSNYLPYPIREEQHRVIGEDDDPEPQFLQKRDDAVDLFPISLGDFEPLVSEGFEAGTSPILSAAALPTAEVTESASGGEKPDAGQLAAPQLRDMAPGSAPVVKEAREQLAPAQNTATHAPVVITKRRKKKPTIETVALDYMRAEFKKGQFQSSAIFHKHLIKTVGLDNSPFVMGVGINARKLFCPAASSFYDAGTLGKIWAKIRAV